MGYITSVKEITFLPGMFILRMDRYPIRLSESGRISTIDVKNVFTYLFFDKKTFLTFFIFATFILIKTVDNSNVPVSQLCTWNVGRTLVLLLEWCDRTPCSSLVCPLSGGSSAYIICIHITRTYDPVTWYSGCRIAFQAKFDSICSNHSCYNIEILIKLLTFFYSTFTNVLFVTFLRF